MAHARAHIEDSRGTKGAGARVCLNPCVLSTIKSVRWLLSVDYTGMRIEDSRGILGAGFGRCVIAQLSTVLGLGVSSLYILSRLGLLRLNVSRSGALACAACRSAKPGAALSHRRADLALPYGAGRWHIGVQEATPVASFVPWMTCSIRMKLNRER
jgi:hypothetical protein